MFIIYEDSKNNTFSQAHYCQYKHITKNPYKKKSLTVCMKQPLLSPGNCSQILIKIFNGQNSPNKILYSTDFISELKSIILVFWAQFIFFWLFY